MKIYISISLMALFIVLQGCGSGSNDKNTRDFRTNFNPYNEPFFPYQWYLTYTKNQFSEHAAIDPDASVHILDAWKYTRGKGVTVAIIDSNFEPRHKDLSENVAAFYNEDDENSNVSNNTDKPSHGLACAGFIAAVPNGFGIIGAAPDSQVLLIKQEIVEDAAEIRAFEYAKNHGAKIISNSWGTGNVSPAVAQEIRDIKDQNITIFFASGNNGTSDRNTNQNLDIPGVNDESELPSVIGIGATNEYNQLASYSNYGRNIDMIAPGGEALGLLGLDDTGTKGSRIISYQFKDGYEITLDDSHAFETGTSFACPVTAGVAALMLGVNPRLTPDQIRTILIETADKIEPNKAYYDQNGFDTKRAYGKVNAAKAVEKARTLVQ